MPPPHYPHPRKYRLDPRLWLFPIILFSNKCILCILTTVYETLNERCCNYKLLCDASSSQTMGLSPQALWWKRESMRITRGLPTMAIIVVSRRGPQFRENICCLICKRKWRISRHDGKVNVELPCTCLLKCCCQRTVAYMTGRLVSELHKFMRLIYFKRPLAERFRYEPNNDSWMVKGGGGSCTYTRSVTFISTKQRFLDYRQFKITREMRYLLINNFHFNTYYLIYLKVKS